MNTRTLSRWLMSVVFAAIFLVTINLLLAKPVTQARPAAALINCAGSIQACIDAANDGDTILIAAGRYTESLTLSKPVSLTGENRDTTILHAITGQRVLTVTGATISNSVVISGLTFTGGEANLGGGMLITDTAQPTLQAVQFISNAASNRGGGVYANAQLTLIDAIFSANNGGGLYANAGLTLIDTLFSVNQGGGAIVGNQDAIRRQVHIVGGQFIGNSGLGLFAGGDVEITGTQFLSNTGASGSGAYISGGSATIINARFEDNYCTGWCEGGGLYFVNSFFGRTITITNTQFINNSARNGGGLSVHQSAATVIVGSRFERNTSVEYGGAIHADFANLQLMDTAIISNVTNGYGAGILTSSFETVTLVNSRVENNKSRGMGGGVYADVLVMTNTDFISNTSDAAGGGVYVNEAYLQGGRFERNAGSPGGALLVYHNLYMTGTEVISNVSTTDGGGALTYRTTTINNSRFENNLALRNGGGLGTDSGPRATRGITLTDVQFINNTAEGSGGGLYLYSNNDSQVVNTLFVNNASNGNGSAMYFGQSSYITQPPQNDLIHLTIASVSNNSKAAIAIVSSTLNMTNTIITSHTIAISNTGGTVYEDYNLFFNTITNTIGVTSGGHSLIGDPKFVDPLHGNYHLQFGSAAIDHGIDAGVYSDLDGNPRPHGAGFDIGAYEFANDMRYVATTGNDVSNVCLDSATPCATIQHAINVANAGDQVLIASGLYTQSATLDKPVSLTGENRDTTILHAITGQRVLTVTGAGISNSVVISGLTLTGGDVSDPINPDYLDVGGGIYIASEEAPTIYNLNIISNTANHGGGIADFSSMLTLVNTNINNNVVLFSGAAVWAFNASISHSSFVSNSAGQGLADGEAVWVKFNGIIVNSRFESNQGGAAWIASAIITNTDFISNHAAGSIFSGAGLASRNAEIFGGRFENNVAEDYRYSVGGGVAVSDTLYVSGTRFIRNLAGSGGAVWSHHADIENAYFAGNIANGLYKPGGGAIFGEESLVVANSQFVSNTAPYGGAILLGSSWDPSVPAQATITNSVFTDNKVITDGAALFAGYRNSDQITLIHLTIADSSSNDKPAISIAGVTLHVTNTIIASHVIAISNTGGTVNEDYNLFFNTVTNTVGVTNGGHSFVGDPKFVDPLNGNYHLQFGSAAIDHGVDASVYTDLDGHPRPVGTGFDIGAYEYQECIFYLSLPLIRK